MTTTEIKCLQSGDVDSINDATPCVIINGSSTSETAVDGDTAQDARDNARESGAYGCEVSTVGEWARTAPEKQAYVLEERGAKNGNVWWLSDVERLAPRRTCAWMPRARPRMSGWADLTTTNPVLMRRCDSRHADTPPAPDSSATAPDRGSRRWRICHDRHRPDHPATRP